MRIYAYFEAGVLKVSQVFNWISRAAMAAMTLFVVINVITRYVGYPIYGIAGFVGAILSVVIAFNMAYTAVEKGHVAVTLVTERLAPRLRSIVDSTTIAISIGLFGLLTAECITWGTRMMGRGYQFQEAKLVAFPFIYGLGLGAFLLCLVLLVDFRKSLAEVVARWKQA